MSSKAYAQGELQSAGSAIVHSPGEAEYQPPSALGHPPLL